MPPKSRFLVTDKDDLIWEKLDEATEKWDKSVRTEETYRAIGNFILKYKDGKAKLMHAVIKGGYNMVYRLEYKDGSSAVMRIPIRDVVPFPDEKVRYEVATIRYVAVNTTIPVPYIYHYGTADDNPTGLGPFIIMDYIEHHQSMSEELLDPGRAIDKHPILDPEISEEKLEILYSQMANILLQLSSLKFPRIGSLVEEEDGSSISATGRPLIENMNDLIVHTNAPASILPSQTYASADEWYSALADMHMAQLALQHNDAVEGEDDARDKYVSRQLFRNLAAERRLASEPESDGGFRLFSEDFRPANVLLDKDLRVVGVIDWEFAYAAPAQFSSDPPWWLLLQSPDYWDGGYRAWMRAYEPRLRTFLRVLEAEEKKMAIANLAGEVGGLSLQAGAGKTEVPLSQRMRESWDTRTWMLSYAARKSWAFDFLWWKFLDKSYFGPNENQDYQARLELLSEPQRAAMDAFVARKMEESRNREIVKWTDEQAGGCLDEVLV
ncbi:phosphotransferase family protein [Hypoxylon crocopeplum]|nr:phosphotransferase family protein [Hypoxylon crocopeplum]